MPQPINSEEVKQQFIAYVQARVRQRLPHLQGDALNAALVTEALEVMRDVLSDTLGAQAAQDLIEYAALRKRMDG